MAVDLPAPEYPEITTRSSRRDSMVSGAGVLLTAMAHMMTPTADHPRRATIYGRRRGGATGTGSDQAASAPLRAAVSLGAARVRPQRPRAGRAGRRAPAPGGRRGGARDRRRALAPLPALRLVAADRRPAGADARGAAGARRDRAAVARAATARPGRAAAD